MTNKTIEILKKYSDFRQSEKMTYLHGDYFPAVASEIEAEMYEKDFVLKMFQDFFIYHNEANKGYKGIDDLFNEWWNNRKQTEIKNKI